MLADVAPAVEIHPAAREFSFSRLQKFHDCPWAWYCDYVLGIRAGDTDATRLGRTTHWIIEEATKALLAGREVTPRKMREFIASISSEAPEDVCLDEQVLAEARELANAGLAMMTIGQPPERVAVEQHLSVPIGPGRVVHGYVDYFEWNRSHGLIRDWKSNRVPYEPVDTKQLSLYGWLASAAHPEVAIWDVELGFLRLKQFRRGTVGPDEIAAVKEWTFETVADIDESLARGAAAFEPNPSHRCVSCSHSVRCPAGDRHVDPAVLDNADKLQEAIRAMLVVEGRLSTLREAIRARLQGQVVVGDTLVGVFEMPSWEVKNVAGLAEAVKAAGGDPMAVLQVDREKLKRFLKAADPDMRAAIEALMVPKMRREFGHKLASHDQREVA